MSSRSLGVVSLERFLAVERYRETHQAPSTHPYRTAESGGRVGRVTPGSRGGPTALPARPDEPGARASAGTPGLGREPARQRSPPGSVVSDPIGSTAGGRWQPGLAERMSRRVTPKCRPVACGRPAVAWCAGMATCSSSGSGAHVPNAVPFCPAADLRRCRRSDLGGRHPAGRHHRCAVHAPGAGGGPGWADPARHRHKPARDRHHRYRRPGQRPRHRRRQHPGGHRHPDRGARRSGRRRGAGPGGPSPTRRPPWPWSWRARWSSPWWSWRSAPAVYPPR